MASSPDPTPVARFRTSLSAALAATDRPAFDAACQTITLSTHLSLPQLLTLHPDLAPLLAFAVDMHWLEPPSIPSRPPPTPHANSTTWAAVLKRAVSDLPPSTSDDDFLPTPASPLAPPQDPSLFRHPHAFVPSLPAHPLTLPTAVLQARNGLIKTSFRRWKCDSSSLPPSTTQPPEIIPTALRKDPQSDSSSVASTSSQHSQRQSPQHLFDSPNILAPHPAPPLIPNDFEAILLANMPNLADARPAGAAAAAAFRALVPFLPADDQLALQRAFSTTTPLHCLAIVLRVAENASAQSPPSNSTLSSRRISPSPQVFTSSPQHLLSLAPADTHSKGSVWGNNFGAGATWASTNLTQKTSSLAHPDLTTPASFVGLASTAVAGSSAVWATDPATSNASSPVDPAPWRTVYAASPTNNLNSGLNANAPPFTMDALQPPQSGL